MANPSKVKGTAFESNLIRYLQTALDDERIERRALHGAQDRGDVYGIRAHGFEGIAECKDYARYSEYDLDRWKEQTLAERDNADAGFALLVVHRKGKSAKAGSASFGKNVAWLTVADLRRISGSKDAPPMADPFEDEEYLWCSMALEDVVVLMGGGEDG